MGAWDSGNFDNDTALDFVGDVTTLKGLTRPFREIETVWPGKIDADMAAAAMAAADMVATHLGRTAGTVPPSVQNALEELPKLPPEVADTARRAVEQVRDNSELADLWRESDPDGWHTEVRQLLDRLDLSQPFQIEQATEDEILSGGFFCALCEKKIAEGEEVAAEIPLDDLPGISMTMYYHAACLEKRFAPPHFDDDNKPTAELLAQIKAAMMLGEEE